MNTKFVFKVSCGLILLVLLIGVILPVQAGSLDLPARPAAATADTPHTILSKLEVRQAIAYRTDRYALAQAAYPDRTDAEIEAMLTDTFLPTDHRAYSEPSMTYPHDPQAGMDLLDSLGWMVPEGGTYRTDGANERLAVVLSTAF